MLKCLNLNHLNNLSKIIESIVQNNTEYRIHFVYSDESMNDESMMNQFRGVYKVYWI